MSDWYHAENGQRVGPVSAERLRARLVAGELPRDALVWRAGMEDWLPADRVPELGLAEEPPPIPGASTSGPARLPARRRPWPVTVLCIAWLPGGLLLLLGGASLAAAGLGRETAMLLAGLLTAGVGLLLVLAAVGLWRLRPWGWQLAIAAALVTVLGFPLGTLVGILLLVYLGSAGMRALYSSTPVEDLPADHRAALARLGDSGLGLAMAIVLLACVAFSLLILPAIAIPNLLNAIQRGKQARTMADMRAVATALESHEAAEGVYPPGGPDLESVRALLEPTHARDLPTLDGWNAPILYERGPEGRSYRLESHGQDSVDSGPDEGPITSFRHDIVFDTGAFVAWPEGTRR